jgi:hypothetical protein
MPMAAAAGIGAAGSIVSSLIGGHSASKAAKMQHEAALTAAGNTNNSLASADQQLYIANDRAHGTIADAQASLKPFQAAGQTGLDTLVNGQPAAFQTPAAYGNFNAPTPFSFTAADFKASPGYQWALDQGKQAIEHNAAAQGGLMSGDTLKELTKYAIGAADQDYGNSYNRALQTYQTNFGDALSAYDTNRGTYQQNFGDALQGYDTNYNNWWQRGSTLAGIGLDANSRYLNTDSALLGADQGWATGMSGNIMNASQQITAGLTGAGNAGAAGQIAQGNAWANGLSNATSGISNAIMLQGILGKQQANTGPATNSPNNYYEVPND